MKKIYCSKCENVLQYTKFKRSKISKVLNIILVLSTLCATCSNNNDKMFNEEENIYNLWLINKWAK